MRKLLNVLYITNENYYLSRERENVVVKDEGKVVRRFPIHILEGIVCFNYVGVSPALIRLCNENHISLTFLTPQGQFSGKFIGLTNGNVLLRREQYRIADDAERSMSFNRRFIEAKIINSRKLYLAFLKDHKERVDQDELHELTDRLRALALLAAEASTDELLRGIEGEAAKLYFQHFDQLILNDDPDFRFVVRSKRPPLNCVNAVLSFLYSMLAHEMQSALETVGLDSYVGFMHTDRPGRAGLALDMMEELRAFMVDRLVLTMVNRKQLRVQDFEIKETGAVLLNDKGRAKVLEQWQLRKQKEVLHPFIREKIQIGLIPFVQAQLLSRCIRKDIASYPPFMA